MANTIRALWASVVVQALRDLMEQPMDSIAYQDAVAFFTRDGTWAEARTSIGDFLGLHRDELARLGGRYIARREAGDHVKFRIKPPRLSHADGIENPA